MNKKRKKIYATSVYLKISNHSYCSGSRVGPYTVLTAAHCIELADNQTASITAYLGGNGSKHHARGVHCLKLQHYHPNDAGHNRYGYDFAIIVLDKPLGNVAGYCGAKNVHLEKDFNIKLVGFPQGLDTHNPWLSQGKVLKTSEESGVVSTDAYAAPGNSGSPVFIDDTCSIVAVAIGVKQNGAFSLLTTSKNYQLASFIERYRNRTP